MVLEYSEGVGSSETGAAPDMLSFRVSTPFLSRSLTGLVLAGALCLFSNSAAADPGQRWTFFGIQKQTGGAQYDRARAREREAQPARGYATISSANLEFMAAAVKRYSAVAKQGGWRPIPMVQLRRGSRGEPVRLLKMRLAMSGDMPQQAARGHGYDYHTAQAVQNFQLRHGLTPTGEIDKSTLVALNVSAKARLQQLRLNLSRLKNQARSAAGKYVLVNIPAAQIEAVEQGEVISRHSAVVGKIDRQSPVLRSSVHEINFNPYWNVPASIVRKDLVPKARQYASRGKDILSTYKIDAFDGSGRKLDPARINWSSRAVYGYAYRQRPWEDNSMGFVKINFPNQHAVYMHDTPSKSLFGRNFRAESSGCVRVQNVEQLVAWMLGRNDGWDIRRVRAMKQTGERKDVRLKKKVPVYFAYITAWATPDGVVHFRRDLYRRDGVGAMASAY